MSELKHISEVIKDYLSDTEQTEEQKRNEEKRRLSLLRNDMEEYYSDQLTYELKEFGPIQLYDEEEIQKENQQFQFTNVIKKM